MKRTLTLTALSFLVAGILAVGFGFSAAEEGTDLAPASSAELVPTPEFLVAGGCDISSRQHSFSECESWCYSSGCGVTSWDSSSCTCYCGYTL